MKQTVEIGARRARLVPAALRTSARSFNIATTRCAAVLEFAAVLRLSGVALQVVSDLMVRAITMVASPLQVMAVWLVLLVRKQ